MPGWNRTTVSKAITLLLALVIADTAAYFVLRSVQEQRNLFYDKSGSVTRDRIERWLRVSYHPRLGWDFGVPAGGQVGTPRGRKEPMPDSCKVKMFGDSFTYGSEVDSTQTIGAFMERETGWDVLNYGIGGYGTDQAFIKYQLTTVKSEYTILGIQCENIGRLVSVYGAYYMRTWSPPKPRYYFEGEQVRLFEPVTTPTEAFKLLEPDFVASLRSRDYWPWYYDNVLGAPPRLQWPASRLIVEHLPFFWRRLRIEVMRRWFPSYEVELESYKYTHLYDPSTEAFRVMTWIVDSFVTQATARGEHPVILVLPDQFSLDLMARYGRSSYAPLVQVLAERQYQFVDLGPVFLKQDYAPLFVGYNRHYSPKGNELVAGEVLRLIRDLDAPEPP